MAGILNSASPSLTDFIKEVRIEKNDDCLRQLADMGVYEKVDVLDMDLSDFEAMTCLKKLEKVRLWREIGKLKEKVNEPQSSSSVSRKTFITAFFTF